MAKDSPDMQDGVPRLRKGEERPTSLSAVVPREKLNKNLQKIIDREDDFMDELYDGQVPDTTDSSVRYAAYANRLRTIMLSAHRYVAYTSDIGESFRPIAHPWLIRGAYTISWAYLIGDVSNEGWKAYKRNQAILHPHSDEHKDARLLDEQNQTDLARPPRSIPAIEDYRSIMVQRAVFQSIASMGLPALTIHSIVKYSGKALKTASNKTIRTWGPIGLGLAAVPALPFLFDKPVEEAVEWVFYNAFNTIGGPAAVGDRHVTGRQLEIKEKVKEAKERMKKKLHHVKEEVKKDL